MRFKLRKGRILKLVLAISVTVVLWKQAKKSESNEGREGGEGREGRGESELGADLSLSSLLRAGFGSGSKGGGGMLLDERGVK